MAIGKQILVVLQSAAALIPVPLVREAVGIALKLLKYAKSDARFVRFPPTKGYKMIYNI